MTKCALIRKNLVINERELMLSLHIIQDHMAYNDETPFNIIFEEISKNQIIVKKIAKDRLTFYQYYLIKT